MNSFRTILTLVLTFAAGPLLLPCVHAASQPFRLFEIFCERYIDDNGTLIADQGRLNARGEFIHVQYGQVPAGFNVPPEARNRNLLPYPMWVGYLLLGQQALSNFQAVDGVQVGGQVAWFVMAPAADPKLDVGELVNISTRATITPGGDAVIGGFVVMDNPRHVLIRGIGPGLAPHGVNSPLADPKITLFKQGSDQAVASNDDWSSQSNVDAIEQAEIQTGAFPVTRNSKDAMLLIELQPGAYTVHLTTSGSTGGAALLEVYTVP